MRRAHARPRRATTSAVTPPDAPEGAWDSFVAPARGHRDRAHSAEKPPETRPPSRKRQFREGGFTRAADSANANPWELGGPRLAQPALLELAAELLDLAAELFVGLVEGEDDLGGARDLVAVEQPAVAVQVGEDGLGHLERALLGLDQGGLERVDVVASPQALVAHDRDLAVDPVDRIEVVLDPDLLEDVRVARVEAALLLDLAELPAARAVERVPVVQQEHALRVVLALGVLAVADAALHPRHLARTTEVLVPRHLLTLPGRHGLAPARLCSRLRERPRGAPKTDPSNAAPDLLADLLIEPVLTEKVLPLQLAASLSI